MKTTLALFLACFTTALFGQAPPILRTLFTTNTGPNAVAATQFDVTVRLVVKDGATFTNINVRGALVLPSTTVGVDSILKVDASGVVDVIGIGTGLAFDGTTLSASGGGIPTLNGTGTNLSAIYITGTTNPPFRVNNSNGTAILFVNTNGNVGIGTNAPGAALDVQGNGVFSGSVTGANFQVNGGNLNGPSFVNINVAGANKIGAGGVANTMYQNTIVLGTFVAGDGGIVAATGLASILSTNASARPNFRMDGIRTNSLLQGYVGSTPVLEAALETNGLWLRSGIIGITNASDAAAGVNGYVGQFTNALLATGSALAMSTTITTNILTLTLTAGDWDVEGNVNFNEGASTVSAFVAGISTNSVTIPTDGSEVYSGAIGTLITTVDSITLPRKRINVSAPMVVYLTARCNFSAGTITGFGSINARRVR